MSTRAHVAATRAKIVDAFSGPPPADFASRYAMMFPPLLPVTVDDLAAVIRLGMEEGCASDVIARRLCRRYGGRTLPAL